MTANKSTGTSRSLLARSLAGVIMIALYCVNTVVISGFALTAGVTSAKAHNGGFSSGRGRGRGRGRGWRGRGRGRGGWWPGSCHLPGTSLWYSDCW
jgi:hypothetical protein